MGAPCHPFGDAYFLAHLSLVYLDHPWNVSKNALKAHFGGLSNKAKGEMNV
jgi:hypothetical protein